MSVEVETDGITSELDFIVDTGSPETLFSENAIRIIGYTPVDSIEDVTIQTVSGSATAYRYVIDSMTALGVSLYFQK